MRRRASNTPVVAAPSIAPTAPEDMDPILGAINAHHQATMAFLRAVNAEAQLVPGGPKFKKASTVTHRAWDAFSRATERLLEKPPASLRGARALLDYVRRFNRGEFKVGKGNYTEPDMWPADLHFLDERLLILLDKVIAEAIASADADTAIRAHQHV